MVCPKIYGDFDYEGELALVIGKPGRHIAKAEALRHVFGYACFNDGSIRDLQFKHSIAGVDAAVGTGPCLTPWQGNSDDFLTSDRGAEATACAPHAVGHGTLRS
jgi:2-keto-4-pentenoate hydratase/2-oxohepta-3-ene-1,7-dioic acid hydratase in catechol pathway